MCVRFVKGSVESVPQREQLVNNENELNNSPSGPFLGFLYGLLSGLLNLYVDVRQDSLLLMSAKNIYY